MADPTNKRPPSSFGLWGWLAALAPMLLCGGTIAALFFSGVVTMRASDQERVMQTAQQHASATARASTSTARVQATRQILTLTSGAFAATNAVTQQNINSRAATSTAQYTALYEGRRWARLYADSFDFEKEWTNLNLERTDVIKRNIEEGKFIWRVTSLKGTWQAAIIPTLNSVSKFYLSVEVLPNPERRLASAGVIFRQTGNNFYYYTVDVNQTVVVGLVQNNQVSVLWSQARPEILINDANHLEILGDVAYYQFFLNGRLLADLTDTRLPNGSFGLATHALPSNTETTFTFDDFEMRLPALTPNLTVTPPPTAPP